MKKVVVVGGGTGTYTLLRGLREYTNEIAITAIVTMADSGGSTGRLRDEFGQLPVGDVRQALAALSPEVAGQPNLLRDLFLYRFHKGDGLTGHNFGNLFLTALTDLLGSEAAAIKAAGELLEIEGKVVPVTTDQVHLKASFQSGRVVVGEHDIDECAPEHKDDGIIELSLSPQGQLATEARDAIMQADMIILGPGDFYTSILANCVVDGFREVILESQARLLFVANLMARSGQTIGMQLSDYVTELERYLGRLPDIVLIPDTPLPETLVARYVVTDGVHPVIYDSLPSVVTVVRAPLVGETPSLPVAGDTLKRSLIRHDSQALAAAVVGLLHSDTTHSLL